MKTQKVPQLTESEKDYIFTHRKTKTVPELARDLKRGDATIYGHFRAKGWKWFKRDPPPRPTSHPFRKQNQKLENYFISRKIKKAANEASTF